MSAIDDYGCHADGCQRDAAELVETDDGARVLLCLRCHQQAYDAEQTVTLADGHVLAWDMATGWYVLPDGGDMSENEHVVADLDDDLPIPLNVMIRTYRDEIRRLAEPESDIWWCAEYIADWGDELANRLAEAEARAERLQEALVDEHLKWEAWVAEITNQQGKIDTSRAGAIALIRASQPTLKDGDLPDPDGGDAS